MQTGKSSAGGTPEGPSQGSRKIDSNIPSSITGPAADKGVTTMPDKGVAQGMSYECSIQMDREAHLELNWWIVNLKIVRETQLPSHHHR